MKLSLAALLAVSLALDRLPHLEGKAMPLRAVFYSLAALVVPLGWVLLGRRPPYPPPPMRWLSADSSSIREETSSTPTLLAGRLRIATWNAAAFAVGFTVTAHTAWELAEFALDRWLGADLNVDALGGEQDARPQRATAVRRRAHTIVACARPG